MIRIVISDRVRSHKKYGKSLVAGIRIHRRRGTIGPWILLYNQLDLSILKPG